MTKLFNTTLNDVFKTTALGSTDSAIGNAFYGINHRQTPGAVPINKDSGGLTFFTRPQLNLSTANIRAERRFIPLLNQDTASIQNVIRCYLDPRLNNHGTEGYPALSCPLVDPQSAFIPILTNHLLSCSGWPDVSLDTYTSKPGGYKEVFSHVDSVFDIYSAYDISCSFRNMVSDPITSMFYIWCLYESLVFQGILVPYPDFIVNNEIDYNTRIYRLVLDVNRRFVQKIACSGASYPYSVPMGAAFNYDTDKPLNMSNNELQFNFKTVGACYQDDIAILEFNKTVEIFNPNMRMDDKRNQNFRDANMKKIPYDILMYFNNRGYPRINPITYELEWYTTILNYEEVTEKLKIHSQALTTEETQYV